MDFVREEPCTRGRSERAVREGDLYLARMTGRDGLEMRIARLFEPDDSEAMGEGSMMSVLLLLLPLVLPWLHGSRSRLDASVKIE